MKYRLFLISCLVAVTGCASNGERVHIRPADEIYREANNSMRYGNYKQAEQQLRQVLARYPFTDYAAQAHLDILFAYLQLGDPDSLVEEADRFIRENPRHPRIDYAYYMRGMGFYRATRNIVEDLFNIDTAKREISNAETAFNYFRQLTSRFPDSDYAPDARLRMIELKQRIARHEIYIADYYLRRGAWVAAIRRAERVLEDMQGTPAEVDALMVLERGYEELGLNDLAETARRVLQANPQRKPVVLEQR